MKIAFITAAIAASITASAVVYEGETYTTKGKAPNSAKSRLTKSKMIIHL